MNDRFTEPKHNGKTEMLESDRSSSNKIASAYPTSRLRSLYHAGPWIACVLATVLALMPATAGAQTAGTADLLASISPTESIAAVGDEVVFTSTYTNNGPDTATDVRLMFLWQKNSTGITFVSANASAGTIIRETLDDTLNQEVIELPVMPSGESVTMTVTFLATAKVQFYPQAVISSPDEFRSDPRYYNNYMGSILTVTEPGTTLWDATAEAYAVVPGYAPFPNTIGVSPGWYVNQDVMFEVTVNNKGPAEATSVTITNSLWNGKDAYLESVGVILYRLGGLVPASGASNLRTEVVTDGLVTGIVADGINYSIGSMEPGSSVTFRFTYTISESQMLVMESIPTFPSETSENPTEFLYAWMDIVAEEMPDIADLSVSASSDQTDVPFGENHVVHVAVTNNGPAPAYDVTAFAQSFLLHSMVDYITAESTAGTVESHLAATVDTGMKMVLPVLNPGQTETMTVVLRKNSYSEINLLTGVTYDRTRSLDPIIGNQSQILMLTTLGEPPVFDLQANITASAPTAQPGGLLVYNMSVTNAGPDDMPSTISLGTSWDRFILPPYGPNGVTGVVTVEDSDVEFLNIQNSGQWNLDVNEHSLLASLPFLAAGETANLVLVYRVSPDAVGDEQGNINNRIYISAYPLQDSNEENNISTVLTPIGEAGGPEVDLLVTQAGPAQAVPLNQPVSYSVTAKNLGPTPTSAAYVSYLIPQGATLASVTSDKGTPVVINKYASVADVPLAVGEAVTMTVNIVPEQLGQLDSYSAGSSNLFDPNIGNNFTANSTLVVESLPGEEPPVITPEHPCTNPVDLSAQINKYRAKGKLKKKTGEWQYRVQANVGITNTGTACAPATTVKLYLSDDLTLDSSDLLLATKNIKLKCPGKKAWKAKKVNFKMKLDKGVSPAGRYIIAVADGDNIVPECNEDNNSAFAF